MNYFNHEDCLVLIPDIMKDLEKYGFEVVSREGGIGIVPKQGINDWFNAHRKISVGWDTGKQNAIDVTAEDVTRDGNDFS